jgi:hypothetical protein
MMPYLKNKLKEKRVGDMAQVVNAFLTCKALSSNTCIKINKNEYKKR